MLHEPHLYKMVRDGVEAHKRLCSSGLSYRYRMTPCNFTFFETGAMDGLIDRLETMPSTERFEILTRRELLESEPALTPAVVGGVRFPDCSLGEAGALCRELIREAVRAGVETRTSTEVVGFAKKDGKNIKTALSKTKGGDITADKFVIAAGPWSGTLSDQLGIGIPTIPIKGHLLRWKTDPQFLSNMVWTGKGALFPETGMICAGGDHNFTGFDKTPNDRTIGILSSIAVRTIPRLAALIPTVWTGLRPATPDSLPIIGYSERLSNVVVATGHFHEGFTTSAITGEIVADLITKGSSDKVYLDKLKPDRFNC
jgi:glycine/D-amino acid oxidase-like deaminating enzyme